MKRPILSILTILFLAISCSTANHNKTPAANKFDSLPLPADSTAFYFKIKADWQDTTQDALDTFTNSWYSKMLFALKEPIIKDYHGDKEIYRFTWLRTFHHPAVVRVEKQGNSVWLFGKISNGAGGYEPGKIIFNRRLNWTQKEVDTINHLLDAARFWALQTETPENRGNDGSEWIIEVLKDNQYHMVTRWTPGKGTAFRRIGEYLLSISGIKNESGEKYFY